MEILTELKERGIKIWLGEDGLKLSPKSKLSAELIAKIKAHKDQIIESLSNQKGADFISHIGPIVDRVLADISSKYPSGCIEYLKKYDSDLYRKLMDMADELETYQGEGNIEKYKVTLNQWHGLWIKAINTCRQGQ